MVTVSETPVITILTMMDVVILQTTVHRSRTLTKKIPMETELGMFVTTARKTTIPIRKTTVVTELETSAMLT